MTREDELARLLKLLENPTLLPVFFQTINSSKWIPDLKEKGIFAAILASKNSDVSSIVLEKYVLNYLIKHNTEFPEEVLALLREGIAGYQVFESVIDLAIVVEEEYLVDYSELILQGLQIHPRVWRLDRLVQFSLRLLNKNLNAKAKEILLEIFAVFPNEENYILGLIGRCSEWEYSSSFKYLTSSADSNNCIELLDIARQLLINASNVFESSEESSDSLSRIALSSIYLRRAIEASEQNQYCDEIFGALVDSVRDLALLSDSSNSKIVRDLMNEALNEDNLTMKRIAINHFRIVKAPKETLIKLLLNTKFKLDLNLHHEYWLLFHEAGYLLNEVEQSVFLEQLQVEISLVAPTAEKAESDEYLRLANLNGAVQGPLSDRLNELQAKFDFAIEHPDFLLYQHKMDFSATSPYTFQQIAEMSLKEIVEIYSSLDSVGSSDDLSRKFDIKPDFESEVAKASAHKPHLYLDSSLIADLQLSLQLAILEGISRTLETLNNADWLVFYGALESVLEQSSIISSQDLQRLLIMFETLLEQDKVSQSTEIRAKVIFLVENMFELSFNFPESFVSGEKIDSQMLGLNSCIGKAINVMIKLGIYLQDTSNKHLAVDLISKMLITLTNRRGAFPDYVLSQIGRPIPWILDLGLEELLDSLLLSEIKDTLLWNVIWRNYILYGNPHSIVLSKLGLLYEKAIGESLWVKDESAIDEAEYADHLVGHVIWYYLCGVISIDSKLMGEYLENLSRQNALSATTHLARLISPNENPESLIFERVKTLWDLIYKMSPVEDEEATQAFSWIFLLEKLDIVWRQERLLAVLARTKGKIFLISDVLKMVAKSADVNLESNLKIVKMIVTGNSIGWEIRASADKIGEVVRAGTASSKSDCQLIASEILGFLLTQDIELIHE